MVNAKANTPNKKRKSLPNVNTEAQSPKKNKPNESLKTPAKNKNAAIALKTPKTEPKKLQKQTPAKTPKPTPGQVNIKKEIKTESKSENKSPKKLKKFAGTAKLNFGKKKEGDTAGKKKRRGQFGKLYEKVKSSDKDVLKEIETRIKTIESRSELTKTAKRKLKLLHKWQKLALGEDGSAAPSKSKKRHERQAQAKASKQEKKGGQQVKKVIKQEQVITEAQDDDSDESSELEDEVKPGKIIKTREPTVEEEEESSEEEEGADEEDDESGEEEEGEDNDEEVEGEDNEEEVEGEDNEEEVEGEDNEEEEEGEDDESGEEEESEEEAEDVLKDVKGKKPPHKQSPQSQQLKENELISKGKKRYVVFVGNLPYNATQQEISEHFAKAGDVRHIRIPNDKQTNKPRGFAYVEFNNETDYQKALSLHHTSIKGRRINVLYTEGGKKKGPEKKNQVKAKNFKLQAMRNQGQLAGSVKQNQKRSFRRGKNVPKAAVNGSSS